jgi:Methyltransferase domain
MLEQLVRRLRPRRPWSLELLKNPPLSQPPRDATEKYIAMGYEAEDFYEHFPCFIGPRLLARFHSLFECYQKTLGIAGHIAEVEVYRGACSFYFAKMLMAYEPFSTTQVHGFDVFERANPDPKLGKGFAYFESYARIRELVRMQGLEGHLLLHQIDVAVELKEFFERHPHLRFRLVVLDAGMYDIVASALREFWPRLSPGGMVVFDQFNHEAAPEETRAVLDWLPAGVQIRTFPNGHMPTAYVVKE